MKLNRLETHDRLEYFTKQSFDIGKCCQDIINKRPFGENPFYIFVHYRTIGFDERTAMFNQDYWQHIVDPSYSRKYQHTEEVPEKVGIWQPRLTKPKSQSNSMLFKAYPGTENIKIIWMIPAPELWDQFQKGKMTENKTICESIEDFKNHREKLEEKEDDDLTDEAINQIYFHISKSGKKQNSSFMSQI